MKNMKKTLVMCISLILVAALAIGGTVAYLTVDPVEKSNIFTVGDIAIELNEEVAVHGAGTVEENENGATYTGVMPGDYLQKEVSVKNTGSRPAYVAVEVTFNNALAINKAIDEVYEGKGYSDAQIQAIYDYIFDGFGLNYEKVDASGNALGMRLTITGDDMPEGVMQVDSVKTITDYVQSYNGNWFAEGETVNYGDGFKGYYSTGMDEYQIRYTYYMLLEKDQTVTLFKGFNVPASFNAAQLEMFENMNIDIVASAIQADNMESAKDAVGNLRTAADIEIAKAAFAILKAEYTDGTNDGDIPEYDFVGAVEVSSATTYAEIADLFAQGKSIYVTEDMTIDGPVTEGATRIEVNGDIDFYFAKNTTLTFKNTTVFNGTGTITVKNGSLETAKELCVSGNSTMVFNGGEHTFGAFSATSNGKIVVNGGTLNCRGTYAGVLGISFAENGQLIVNDGTLNMYQPFNLNANRCDAAYIEINGGKIHSYQDKLFAVRNIMDKDRLEGGVLRGSSIKITGGVFTTTYELDDTGDANAFIRNEDGNADTTRVLEFNTYNGEKQYDCSVTGGTFYGIWMRTGETEGDSSTVCENTIAGFVADGYEITGDATNGYVVSAK